jgi:heterodisulfide reductase subunit A
MGVAKSRQLIPLMEETVSVIQKGLVIGGGLAGMTAALSLAKQGFPCYLVEKQGELGGNLRHVHFTLGGDSTHDFFEKLIADVNENPLINVYTSCDIKDIRGYIGNFNTTLYSAKEDKEISIDHGVIVVATGADEYKPKEYLYGKNNKVITQRELEEKLANDSIESSDLNNVVMIQCVGSRNEDRPYCSKICCSQAIKNALKIKEANPDSNIYILNKDIRTYGTKEEFYLKARDKGVIFIHYDDDNLPVVTENNGGLNVEIFDPLLGEKFAIPINLLILSAAVIHGDNEDLSRLLKIPRNADGFFMEAHAKLRPVDFSVDGIFLCGLAHSPKPIEESIAQAQAAAARAAIPLAKGYVNVDPIVSVVDEEKCFGCGICEYLCPYGSIRVISTPDGDRAQSISASCKGCGVCAARCPKEAISMGRFTSEQIFAQIDSILEN